MLNYYQLFQTKTQEALRALSQDKKTQLDRARTKLKSLNSESPQRKQQFEFIEETEKELTQLDKAFDLKALSQHSQEDLTTELNLYRQSLTRAKLDKTVSTMSVMRSKRKRIEKLEEVVSMIEFLIS